MTESSKTKREPLHRTRLFETAVALADENGLAALTMRGLAARLGVEAMSLYHHVANKEEILDGMVDAIFSEIELTPLEGEWRTSMRERAISTRRVLSRHPWALALVDSRRNPGPATLEHTDATLSCLRGSGFSLAMAVHAMSLLDAYVYGFVLQERNLPTTESDELGEMAEAILEQAMDGYPYLAEFVRGHLANREFSYTDEFEYGLDLILEGIERRTNDHARA